MSFLRAWAPFFQSHARLKGRALHAGGKVRREAAGEGELARYVVEDEGESHHVGVQAEEDAAGADCDCQRFLAGAYCRHIWASLIDLQEQPAEEGGAQARERLMQLSPRPPRARRRAGRRSSPGAVEPEWSRRLEVLRAGASLADSAAGPALLAAPRQVCYVIDAQASTEHHGLIIQLHQRSPSYAGWTTPRKLRIGPTTLQELSDPLDRELCASLVGGMGVDDQMPDEVTPDRRGSYAFLVQPGARAALLRRLADTGRCFLQVRRDHWLPLFWDEGPTLERDADEPESAAEPEPEGVAGRAPQPWRLWLYGEENEASDMVVGLELRRGGRRMPLSEPSLLLPGLDGLVFYDQFAASLDDRGAARWVPQFVDGVKQQPKPMVVPAAEVDRFLDRLYLLPSLPEFDLPEGVRRAVRCIRPSPHIELFTPEAGMIDMMGAPRQHLLAKASFVYDGRRVRAWQRGRFIVASAKATEAPATAPAPAATPAEPASKPPSEPQPEAPTIDGAEQASGPLIRRDVRFEQEALAQLTELGFRPAGEQADTLLLPAKQMPAAVDALLAQGWRVAADRKAVHRGGSPRFSIRSGVDWFELHGGFAFQTERGVQTVSFPQVLAAARTGRQMITLDDGSTGILPEQWLAEHGLLTAAAEIDDDHLRFRPSQAALVDALLDPHEIAEADEAFLRLRERAHRFTGVEALDCGPGFQGQLRTYQREGLGWLRFLRWFGTGGVLADDMGLGKTIQVLAALDRLYGSHDLDPSDASPEASGQAAPLGPTLIVAPRSVIFNWIDEASRFTPKLRLLSYAGADRHQGIQQTDSYDVVVTSYGLVRRDAEALRRIEFEYVILDEAQAIKNPESQGARAARALRSRHRLALTGTPVENHLGDLWSIFEFLNPGMLGAGTRFGELIRGETPGRPRLPAPTPEAAPSATTTATTGGDPQATPDALRVPAAAEANEPAPVIVAPGRRAPRELKTRDAAAQIGKALRPFILRRTKSQVLRELPEKTEQTLICHMPPAQRAVYDELLQHYRRTLLKQVDAQDAAGRAAELDAPAGSGASLMVLEALLRLRQAACHPALIDKDRTDLPSAKLQALVEHLESVVEEGHKALVFSQFTSMLALVRTELDGRGMAYEYLDGQTRDRRQRVDRFQSDPGCPVFLISLKAGGLGLNLTAASYVYILDPWWNPAVEQQAIDRAHRMGQKRHVFAYRLISADTVEQRILELQAKKRQLADAIVGGQESAVLRGLTREDLEMLLS